MPNTVISFPIPLFQNLPINAQFYEPSRFFIENITLGLTTIVETTEDHNYVIGQQVRLIIPPDNKSRQLNGISAFVISIPSVTEVEIDFDSAGGQAFVVSSANNQPQILAIGDINSGVINSQGPLFTNTNIPGSFINISPE